MSIIEDKEVEKDPPIVLIAIIPVISLIYGIYNDRVVIPILLLALTLISYVIFRNGLEMRVKRGHKVFELNENEIYHHFNIYKKPGTINLLKVSLIRYGKDYVGFEGPDHYAKEIFFPKQYQKRISDIVNLVQETHPQVKIAGKA